MKIVTEDGSEEQQKQEFFEYLDRSINGFCSAFLDRTGRLDPLYSPLDMLQIMDDIISERHLRDDNYKRPSLIWLDQAVDCFSALIRETGNYDEAVAALLGGRIHASQIDTVARMSQMFTRARSMQMLLFHLGLLRVGDVNGDVVSLLPVMEGKPDYVMRLLTSAYEGEMLRLMDEEVRGYTKDLEKLSNDMIDKLPAAIKALKAQYAPMAPDVLREYPVQDRIFQVLQAHFVNEDLLYLAKEMTVTNKRTRMNTLMAIKGEKLNFARIYGRTRKSRFKEPETQLLPDKFNGHEVYGYVAEMKVIRTRQKDETAMVEALQQALKYRRDIKCNAKTVWLMGIVCKWEWDSLGRRLLKVMVRYGEFNKAKITKSDLEEGKYWEYFA